MSDPSLAPSGAVPWRFRHTGPACG